MGPEAVPRQILCEELSGTLVKPSKNEGGRYAIRNPSDVKSHFAKTLIKPCKTDILVKVVHSRASVQRGSPS